MEYTKDIILNNTRIQKESWKNKNEIKVARGKLGKIFSLIILTTVILMAIDSLLLFHFVTLLQGV